MLDRYQAIVSGQKRPRFKYAREQPGGLPADELKTAGLDQLWLEHDAALERLSPAQQLPGTGTANLVELKDEIAHRLLRSCCFCEHQCRVDRTAGKTGICGVPARSRVASEFLHYGEEPELVPSHTIFFTGCSFSCVYCQNWDIATKPTSGRVVNPKQFARIIDQGWRAGSRNVNFVGGNPDSHLHTCIDIIAHLHSDIPVVWNSNAYASTETMKLLDGIIDIFLSDFRYGNDDCARKYSGVTDYLAAVRRNFILAREQAEVMLRHLVLPGHLECCTRPIMEWIAREMPGIYFNLMFQYRPMFHAGEFPEIDRFLSAAEKRQALALAAEYDIVLCG